MDQTTLRKYTQHLPRDCVCYILQFCDPPTTSNVYLVCRPWYHAVDRIAILADKLYDLPQTFNIKQRRWFSSCSLPTLLEEDVQYHRTEVLYVKILQHTIPVSTWSKYLTSCPSLREVIVKVDSNATTFDVGQFQEISLLTELDFHQVRDVSQLSGCRTLRKLCLSCCRELTDAGIRGLESIPTLEELNLIGTVVSTISHLSGCRALRSLRLDRCHALTDDGIRGLETIPTLEELVLSSASIKSISHLRGCRALRKLDVSWCHRLTDA
eukprot:PhF_6_TR984/c3_g4_i8/m.1917